MDTVVPIPCSATIESGTANAGYFTPKGYLNQSIVKEAEAVREKRVESPRYSTTSSDYQVPVSPSSRFPSSSPLIVISPPKDDAAPITVLPTAVRQMPDTHRRSLTVAIIAALLVFLAVVFMLLLVLNA
ncbi:unnamed protein product [Caenorhabditis sp. 36 PRJEB53466]|nr:unnamed protein product [Caenorhabditis sp. 36 PRJEB53466]